MLWESSLAAHDAGRFCDGSTATKESLMSPPDARTSSDAATHAHPSGHPIPQNPGGGNTSVLDNAFIEIDVTKSPYPPLPVAPVPVDRRQNSGPHSYSDPSIYLG
jgi:hypothetical protein